VRWQKLSEDSVLRSAHPRLGGEAVVVEVGQGRYLFALLQQYRPQTEILFFPDEAPLKSAYKLKDRKGEVLEVPRGMYPMLVTFGNLNQPMSVEQVDPANLAATFGPRYTLKSITLEITDEPVTKGAADGRPRSLAARDGRRDRRPRRIVVQLASAGASRPAARVRRLRRGEAVGSGRRTAPGAGVTITAGLPSHPRLSDCR